VVPRIRKALGATRASAYNAERLPSRGHRACHPLVLVLVLESLPVVHRANWSRLNVIYRKRRLGARSGADHSLAWQTSHPAKEFGPHRSLAPPFLGPLGLD
jgi:hypothetical protein